MSFEYELKDSFEYSHKGNIETASFITLSAPTSKHMEHCAALKQSFFRALPNGDDSADTVEKAEKSPEIKGDDIMTMIMRSPNVELNHILLHAKELLTKGLALADGEEKLTKPLWDLLSMDDVESITGEYLANFILASTLRKMNEN